MITPTVIIATVKASSKGNNRVPLILIAHNPYISHLNARFAESHVDAKPLVGIKMVFNKTLQRRILGSARLAVSRGECADEFDSLQVFFTVRRVCHFFCQILPSRVFTLMISA